MFKPSWQEIEEYLSGWLNQHQEDRLCRYEGRPRYQPNSKWGADLYDDMKKQQDRDVEAKRRKLLELENSK